MQFSNEPEHQQSMMTDVALMDGAHFRLAFAKSMYDKRNDIPMRIHVL